MAEMGLAVTRGRARGTDVDMREESKQVDC